MTADRPFAAIERIVAAAGTRASMTIEEAELWEQARAELREMEEREVKCAELLTALEKVHIRYSRDHGEPASSLPFPVEAVFTVKDWQKVQAAIAAIRKASAKS